jgi:hypothetical protein
MSTQATIDSDKLFTGGEWVRPRGAKAGGIGHELGPEARTACLQEQSIYEAAPQADQAR